MIEIGFAIILGFAITSTLCGMMADGSRGDRILIRLMVYTSVLFTLVAMYNGQAMSLGRAIQFLAVSSVLDNLPWFGLGAVFALCVQLVTEGHAYDLWVRLHPQSAPTPEARMGQRSYKSVYKKKNTPATLVGASTEYLSSELDLRTETLIRLCYFAFEDRGALTLSRLEANLRLGTGHRQKAFHKIAAGMRNRPKLKPTVHRYWRSVNGSTRMGQSLFVELCRLARETDNRDRATIDRLTKVGCALGLCPDATGQSIRKTL